MKHVLCIAIGLILYGGVVFLSRSSTKPAASSQAPAKVNSGNTPASVIPPVPGNTPAEREAYTAAVAQRRHTLALLEEQRALKSRAAENLLNTRKAAQMTAKPNWEALVKRNLNKFHALRAEAARQPNGMTPCTICDGKVNITCIMCDHHDGRCVSCHGTGQHNTELCPSCDGLKKCYLCAGSGQMLCPFCDDGTIHANGPMPSDRPPVQ